MVMYKHIKQIFIGLLVGTDTGMRECGYEI